MFEVQLYAKDTQGSIQAIQMAPEGGVILTGIDVSDITLDTLQVSGASDSAQIQLIARQTNPTAVADGAVVFASGDDLGRVLTRPYQVRDLVSSGSATMTLNAADNETTILSAVASTFLDLVYVSGANSSDGAVRIIFRSGTGGTDQFNMVIPANDTSEMHFTVPWRAEATATPWRADFGINARIADPNDVTNTTVVITAQAIQEI